MFFKKKKDLVKVDPVKIKPLFGLKPGVWLSLAYLLGLIIIIFLVGILPDLVHGSKRLSFSSSVYNCAVYLDGTYVGGTPFTTKVKSGKYEVQYKIGDEVIDSFNIKVSKPVLFAWLFPRTQKVTSNATLNEKTYNIVFKTFLQDLVNYSAITEYDTVYHYPPLYTNFIKTVSSYSGFTISDLELALQLITTNEMLLDAKNALQILDYNYDFSEIENKLSTSSFISYYSTDANKTQIQGAKLGVRDLLYKDGNLEVYGHLITSKTESYYISDYEVPESLYSAFLAENEKWNKSNINSLIEDGLVDDMYLSSLSKISSSVKSIKNVSYFSAVAFCEWLSEKTGRYVFIPTEKQWITAYFLSDNTYVKSPSSMNNSGDISSMLGGLWELTSSSYVPTYAFHDELNALLTKYDVNTDIVVKGGSYINNPSDINEYTTGIFPKNMTSDYIGFRISWR